MEITFHRFTFGHLILQLLWKQCSVKYEKKSLQLAAKLMNIKQWQRKESVVQNEPKTKWCTCIAEVINYRASHTLACVLLQLLSLNENVIEGCMILCTRNSPEDTQEFLSTQKRVFMVTVGKRGVVVHTSQNSTSCSGGRKVKNSTNTTFIQNLKITV